MGKSIEVEAPKKASELPTGLHKVLPVPKLVPVPKRVDGKEPVYPTSEIHERLKRNYEVSPPMAAKGCLGAQLDCDIAANRERYKVGWEPLHAKFSKHMVFPIESK
jgi:hypothetical protein